MSGSSFRNVDNDCSDSFMRAMVSCSLSSSYQLSGYFIHFLHYILYIRFDARHGSHILNLKLSFMGYRFFSVSTLLLNSTSQLVLGHVQSVHPPQHVILLLHCAFHLRISVQAAQHTSHLIHSCRSSPDTRRAGDTWGPDRMRKRSSCSRSTKSR